MANIMILNGAARKNGNTAQLVKSFTEGAESSGNTVREFYLQTMNIHGCLGCNSCARAGKNSVNPCVQQDDMAAINEAFMASDVVVFASRSIFGL